MQILPKMCKKVDWTKLVTPYPKIAKMHQYCCLTVSTCFQAVCWFLLLQPIVFHIVLPLTWHHLKLFILSHTLWWIFSLLSHFVVDYWWQCIQTWFLVLPVWTPSLRYYFLQHYHSIVLDSFPWGLEVMSQFQDTFLEVTLSLEEKAPLNVCRIIHS